METMQPLSMLHVKMEVGAESWAHQVPWGHNCLIYVRRGELTVVPTEEGYYEGDEDREPQVRYAARARVCVTCVASSRFFFVSGCDPVGSLCVFIRHPTAKTTRRGGENVWHARTSACVRVLCGVPTW